jgi:Holliday junction resolvase RusA-like endonuclease
MSQRIIVDMAPPREVSPNWSGNRYVKARAVKAYREAAGWCARRDGEGVSFDPSLTVIHARICWPKGHKVLDVENARASLKAAVDGLQDAKLFHNDKKVRIVDVQQTTWGQQDSSVRALYPLGCTILDVSMDGEQDTSA